MKLITPSIIIIAASFSTVAGAESAMQLMQKQCSAFDKAMLTENMGWFEKVAAPEYHEVDTKGKRTDRKTAMAMMKMMFRDGNVKKIKTTVTYAKQNGDSILVLCRSKMEGAMLMSPQAKKPSVTKGDMRFRQTWIKRGGTWMIQELKHVGGTFTVDGKPFSGM